MTKKETRSKRTYLLKVILVSDFWNLLHSKHCNRASTKEDSPLPPPTICIMKSLSSNHSFNWITVIRWAPQRTAPPPPPNPPQDEVTHLDAALTQLPPADPPAASSSADGGLRFRLLCRKELASKLRPSPLLSDDPVRTHDDLYTQKLTWSSPRIWWPCTHTWPCTHRNWQDHLHVSDDPVHKHDLLLSDDPVHIMTLNAHNLIWSSPDDPVHTNQHDHLHLSDDPIHTHTLMTLYTHKPTWSFSPVWWPCTHTHMMTLHKLTWSIWWPCTHTRWPYLAHTQTDMISCLMTLYTHTMTLHTPKLTSSPHLMTLYRETDLMTSSPHLMTLYRETDLIIFTGVMTLYTHTHMTLYTHKLTWSSSPVWWPCTDSNQHGCLNLMPLYTHKLMWTSSPVSWPCTHTQSDIASAGLISRYTHTSV